MMSAQRLIALRQEMQNAGLSAVIITQADNRAYLSGFTGSNGILLVTQDLAQLIVGFIYQEQAAMQAPGWQIVKQEDSAIAKLAELISEHEISELGFDQEHTTYGQLQTYKDFFNQEALEVDLKPYKGIVEKLRQVKDDAEIALISKASEISDHAFLRVLNFIRPGVSEREVALELEYALKKMGADSFAFDTIVVSGARSSMPHGKPTDKIIQNGDFVTMDFGAKYQGYCSDITRTVVVGKPNAEQLKVYQTVLQAHLRALNVAAPGINGSELDAVARNTIIDAGYGKYFGHGLGHSLGRVVHEPPSANPKSEVEFVPGNFITIEPGIYIPNWGGVRIEDTVLITEDGHKSMNRTSKELIIL